MSLRFLLDTTTVSACILPQPNRRLLRKLDQHSPQCAIAAPVWHELVDGQIAAIASSQGLTLVTANAKDFARFEGLEVTDWTRG